MWHGDGQPPLGWSIYGDEEEGQKLRFGDKKTPNEVSCRKYTTSLSGIYVNYVSFDEFYSQAFEPQVIRPGRSGMTNWRPARRNPSCAAIGAWRCLVSWDGLVWFGSTYCGVSWRWLADVFSSLVEYELASAAKILKGPKVIPKSWLILHLRAMSMNMTNNNFKRHERDQLAHIQMRHLWPLWGMRADCHQCFCL